MSIESILDTIGVEGTGKRILVELLSSGPQSAAFLAKKINVPRSSIYDGIHVLEKKNLVVAEERDGASVFSANKPESIVQLIDNESEKLEKAREDFTQLLPKLLETPGVTEPKIQAFSGNEGCRQVMRDILWYKNIETYTLWPMHKMIDIITPEFLEWHNKRRVANNIRLKSVRKAKDKTVPNTFSFLGTRPEDLRELRFLPPTVDFSMSYWIYENNVAFISGGKEMYGFIIHSQEFSEMMKFHFDMLWEKAK